ncbi:MAG: hypothetical protein WC532_05225 [Candidatus Omnitrophota bacterium]
MKRSTKILLIILIVALAAFVARAYVLLAARLVENNIEMQENRAQLKQEQEARQLLELELKATQEQLQKVIAELKTVSDKLSSAEKNNQALLQEKKELEAKLHSLKELKKAIRQTKAEYRQEKAQQYRAKKEKQKEIDAQRLAQGNRGFLVRDGQPTHQPKVKIAVEPTSGLFQGN